MRIAVGSIMQESNSFVPFQTTLETFESVYIHTGSAVLTGFGSAKVEVPGFLSVLNDAGATVVPLLAAHALSGGPVTRPALDERLAALEAMFVALTGYINLIK